jgi:hypothetical protein
MIATVMRPPAPPPVVYAPTTQDVAIVMGGGGDPFAEYKIARGLCERAEKNVSIFAGNDMIEHFPENIDHAVSLHPDKLRHWLPRRKASGFNDPPKVWAHRNYEGAVTHWTRDWSGSTGLFCVKIARELGFVHIVVCGVHMNVESDHFVRKMAWNAALAFRRGWTAHANELRPYLRSMGGWTQQEFGAPTEEWLRADIQDTHRNRNYIGGLKA